MSDESIQWLGDLNDDCTAVWRDLTLRAEWMHGKLWWWAVYHSGEQIASSNLPRYAPVHSGPAARAAAERAARDFLNLN